MGQSKEREFATTRTHACQHDASHLDGDAARIPIGGREANEEHTTGRESGEEPNTETVRHNVNIVRGRSLDKDARDDIRKQDCAFGDVRTNEVKGRGQ